MTSLELYVNVGDPDIPYGETGADYVLLDLVQDILIWTGVDDIVKDGLERDPTPTELINASPIIPISPELDLIVPVCLLQDYSAGTGEFHLRQVMGMGEDYKRYVFLFHFDGATATEPQLEAWDDDTMLTIVNKVLGGSDVTPIENPEDSMVNAVCTTTDDPGEDWGAPLAGNGATYVVKLNQGDGAITEIGGKDLYANIKIKIPTNFANPAIETFSLVVKYTFIS